MLGFIIITYKKVGFSRSRYTLNPTSFDHFAGHCSAPSGIARVRLRDSSFEALGFGVSGLWVSRFVGLWV